MAGSSRLARWLAPVALTMLIGGVALGTTACGSARGDVIDVPGATVQQVHAFETSDGRSMVVVLDVSAAESSIHLPPVAIYVGPDGRRSESDPTASYVPTTDVRPGEQTTAYYSFPHATLGGQMSLQLCVEPSVDCTEVAVPVR